MPKMASSSSTVPADGAVDGADVDATGHHLPSLDRVADQDEAAPGPGHGALDQEQLPLGVGLDDLEVEGGHLLRAHLAGHAWCP